MIDAHLHVVDFLQHAMSRDGLTACLDGSPTERAVVFGLPVKKKWSATEPLRPSYYLDDNAPCSAASVTDELVATLVASLDDDERERVAPLICGFDPTDQLAPEHVELMIDRHDIWRGVGEVLLRHDDLTELTYGENSRAGHVALDGVLDLCAARGWPMLFHQDASSAGRPHGREYVAEVETMLARHRDVPLVWAHAGVSRRVRPEQPALLLELLARHPHLHVDLSWVVFDEVVVDDQVRPDWVEMIARHPDRFVLGSDTFGSAEDHGELVGRWGLVLDQLATSERILVERDNALRLWWPHQG